MLNIAALRQQQIPLAAEPRSPVPFHILMKPIGPACNLACRYCYYPQDETPVNKMDDARLEQFIRRYIAAQPAGAREINFVWQGGRAAAGRPELLQKKRSPCRHAMPPTA